MGEMGIIPERERNVALFLARSNLVFILACSINGSTPGCYPGSTGSNPVEPANSKVYYDEENSNNS